MDSRRSKNISTVQKELLVDFMERNEDLRSGRFTDKFTYRKAQILWNQLAEHLNRRPGAKKSWRQWRKTWHDLRSKLKSKQANLFKQRTEQLEPLEPLTMPEADNLSTIEERILTILANDAHNLQNSAVNETEEIFDKDIDNKSKDVHVIKEELNIEEHPVVDNQQEFIEIHLVQESKQSEGKDVSNDSIYREIRTKEDYYKQKLAILRDDVLAKNRIATALEVIAEKLK